MLASFFHFKVDDDANRLCFVCDGLCVQFRHFCSPLSAVTLKILQGAGGTVAFFLFQDMVVLLVLSFMLKNMSGVKKR